MEWEWKNTIKPRTFENIVAQFALIGVGLAIYIPAQLIASNRARKRLHKLLQTN